MSSDTDAARIAELEDDNRRLRRLLDHNNAPGELRHRLRSTLAVLRSVIHGSATSRRELNDYVAQLEDRIESIARAAGVADQHGEIDLPYYLADELQYYGVSEGDRLKLLGPEVYLQPKAGQIFALVIHELAVNAVEHGKIGVGEGHLRVEWSIEQTNTGRDFLFDWKETDAPHTIEIGPPGFGTEVMTSMLAYELQAHTTFAYQSDGLKCSIRFPMPPRVGRVADR